MDYPQIVNASHQIRNIISQCPSEQGNIYERLYSLFSALQCPSRDQQDGALNNLPYAKKDKETKNYTAKDESSDKSKGTTLNSDQTRRNANELERKRVSNRLNGFTIKDSVAWQEICKRFGPNLNQAELLSMAEVISQQTGIKVDREAKRRKEVLIKWYEENFDIIKKMLPFFKLEDTEGNFLKGEDYIDDPNQMDENDEENENSNNSEVENNAT